MVEQSVAIVTNADRFGLIAADDAGAARGYMEASLSAATRRAYAHDWQDFSAWCDGRGISSLPAAPEAVCLYLSALAGVSSVATVGRRLVAISKAHRTAGMESPTRHELVRATIRGIRRTHGVAAQQKAPALVADVRAMVEQVSDTLIGMRDRAIILVGFAGAFRRSELVGLDVEDLTFGVEGVTINVRRSKTDQEGAGTTKGIPYGRNAETCPVRALEAWLEASGIEEGAIFRPINRHGQVQPQRLAPEGVAIVVKRLATAAGLDAARYAGHSLRAGMATAAAANGVSERSIMKQTGHRSVAMVRRYIREGDLYRDNAAAQVGL